MPIPILLYHTISDDPQPGIAPFAVRPSDLERHLDAVVAGGFTTLTISELVARLDAGEALPAKPLGITFDDGFEDNLTVAAPMLEARSLRSTVYLTTGSMPGRPGHVVSQSLGRMLGWDRLGELEAAGIEIGAHSHTHPQLDLVPLAEAAGEIARSKDLLEAALGHDVTSFAYPHGYATRAVRDEVRRRGFRSACGVRNAFSHERDDHWMLARLTVGAASTADRVEAWLDGTGAPVATAGEQLSTKAWRLARRVRRHRP